MRNLIFIFLIFSISVNAQKTERLKLKKYRISFLSDSLDETSGLTIINDRLFSFNDSGNSGDIFEIDLENPSRIKNTFATGLKNTDWEAISNDGKNFYIGEFGNNLGNRKDLKIYKIPFDGKTIVKDSIQTIPFYYPEQSDFNKRNIKHNFDAEALFFLDNTLHILTKEWATNTVSHYIIDTASKENQPAKKTESFDTGFVVTDASFYDDKLYVVGYTKKLKVYLMVFDKDKNENLFFTRTSKKYILGSALNVGQVEGITANENGLYISNERFNIKIKKIMQSLYFIPYKDLD